MFSGCTSTAFVLSSGQILLPRYLVNGLCNLVETCREYLLAPTDYLDSGGHRSKVKVTAGRRVGEGIHFNAGAR